jgi:hypothetical protein
MSVDISHLYSLNIAISWGLFLLIKRKHLVSINGQLLTGENHVRITSKNKVSIR